MEVKQYDILKLFHFQLRESPAPLNIPTSTPAPDWGGPVACLSGPVEQDRKRR